MPQVRFTQHPKLPKDWGNKPYEKDWVGNMPQDEADRWVRRGVAEIISENKTVIHASAANPESVKSSDEKVKLVEESLQKENEAKVKAEVEAKETKVEEEAEAKAKVEEAAKARTSTVSGAQVHTTVPARR